MQKQETNKKCVDNEVNISDEFLHDSIYRDDLRVDVDAKSLLQKMRLTCKDNLIIAQLNINSIRNKFDLLNEQISNNIDILGISETKLDPSFSPSQFHIAGYMPSIRADKNRHGGGFTLKNLCLPKRSH